MLPNFSQEKFHAIQFLTLNLKQEKNAAQFFPRKCSAIQVADFEFETGENAAHFSHETFHGIRFHFEFETGENAAHFSQETSNAVRLSDV